jgi:GR25 family glycosyltransferase involved in LPS biosynthesis
MGSNMIIDIPSVKTFYVNMDNRVDRRDQTEKLLSNLNFNNYQRYSAKTGKNAIEGCALSHIDILRSNKNNSPFLILEDDVATGNGYSQNIEVPDDVDAIYLGYSMWGYDAERAKKFSRMENTTSFKKVTNNIYKISNMLSTHAIMYCSERYSNAVADIIETIWNQEEWHCDYACSLIQEEFNVYAPVHPYFFQYDYWTMPWTYVSLNKFQEMNSAYKKTTNDSRLNP